MKIVLLISNHVYHYRARIYNRFNDEFRKLGFEFHVLSNSYQEVDFKILFVKHELPFGIIKYSNKIKKINPDIVINFLHLKDFLIIPLTYYCLYKGIPMIYWGHGLNIKDPKNSIKNFLFRYVHRISSSIILYTPNELKYISKKNHKKTFIAYNTLDFSAVNVNNLKSNVEVKQLYGIKENFVVLFISRILPYKGLDILLNIFSDTPEIGLVVAGGGITNGQRKIIHSTPNYYYLGEKYGNEVDEIYQMGDVFSTPGHIGLALNQAFYWGKPVIVLDRVHAPEIYYMQDGMTGYIVKDEIELKNKTLSLLNNKSVLTEMSQNTKKIAEESMSIEKMFSGFLDAINYCMEKKVK